eukprot:TRINITY_DN11067_c0_g3_i1.p1 TRINITY_DN11067_c0_g3~~TRINITY_DN11067_c0_g3_i1.p1  ORF type:complete len:261 (+),score=64.20 TRINITY_DN11067_c0_g3_i1:67-783(+)
MIFRALDRLFIRPNKVKFLVMEHRRRLQKRTKRMCDGLVRHTDSPIAAVVGEKSLDPFRMTFEAVHLERCGEVEDEDLPAIESICEMSFRAMLLGRAYWLRRWQWGLAAKHVYPCSFQVGDELPGVRIVHRVDTPEKVAIVLLRKDGRYVSLTASACYLKCGKTPGKITGYNIMKSELQTKDLSLLRAFLSPKVLQDIGFKMTRDHGVPGTLTSLYEANHWNNMHTEDVRTVTTNQLL